MIIKVQYIVVRGSNKNGVSLIVPTWDKDRTPIDELSIPHVANHMI